MAPVQPTEDYYAILEVTQTADASTLKISYRRLALIKHPDKAKDKAKATSEFQLLQAAYDTLSDPALRRAYDLSYPSIQKARPPKSNSAGDTNRPPHPSTSESNNGKRKSENERRKARREEKLQELNTRKNGHDSEIFEERRKVNKLQSELKILQDEAAKIKAEEAEKNSWNAYFKSFVTKPVEETEVEKAERQRRQLDNSAAQRIKTQRLDDLADKLQILREKVNNIESEIGKINEEIQAENRADLEAKQREAAQEAQRKQAEADRISRARAEKLRKEFEAHIKAENERQAAEAERHRKQQAAEQEKRRKQQVEEQERRRKQQAEEEEQRAREVEAILRRYREATDRNFEKSRTNTATPRKASSRTNPPPPPAENASACNHRAYWAQINGRQICSHCSTITSRYAFQCPHCQILACAPCRDILKNSSDPGQKAKKGTRHKPPGKPPRPSQGRARDFDENFAYYDDF